MQTDSPPLQTTETHDFKPHEIGQARRALIMRSIVMTIESFPKHRDRHATARRDIQASRFIALNALDEHLAAFGDMNCYVDSFNSIANMALTRYDSDVINALLRRGFAWHLLGTASMNHLWKVQRIDFECLRLFISEIYAELQKRDLLAVLRTLLDYCCEASERSIVGAEPVIRYLLQLGVVPRETEAHAFIFATTHSFESTLCRSSLSVFDEVNNCMWVDRAPQFSEMRISDCQDAMVVDYQLFGDYANASTKIVYTKLIAWQLATHCNFYDNEEFPIRPQTWRFLMLYSASLVSGPFVRAKTWFGVLPNDLRRRYLPRFIFGLCTSEKLPSAKHAKASTTNSALRTRWKKYWITFSAWCLTATSCNIE